MKSETAQDLLVKLNDFWSSPGLKTRVSVEKTRHSGDFKYSMLMLSGLLGDMGSVSVILVDVL